MKKSILLFVIYSSIIFIIILLFSLSVSLQIINVIEYIEGKFPSIYNFYLSSLEDLDSFEKEFIDLLQKLPNEEQEYYAKEVYKNGFSLDLLENLKKGEEFEEPALDWSKIKEPYQSTKEEKPIENLPSLIKRIKPSVVVVFTYDDKGEPLKFGSGFFISQNGDVVTNYHVIEESSFAEVKCSDGKTFPISYIVAEDEQNDIIRLSVDIPSKYVYPLSLTTTLPEIGERIIVYGSPLGLEKTVSDGIVSAIREVSDYEKFIQITAPISPGSSGSPVLNMKGEVIGIATFQFVEGQNLNFAIPSERIAILNLVKDEKIFTTEESFEQEKEEKDFDYIIDAYDKALYFIEKSEYKKALVFLSIATETKILTFKKQVYYQIGRCNDELGNYFEAIEAYKNAIYSDSNNFKNIPCYIFIGGDYYKLDLYNEAIEALKKAIYIDPSNNIHSITYKILGFIYNTLELYKESINALQLSIDIDPNATDTRVYTTLGASYMCIELYEEAIEVLEEAIRVEPDHVNAHFGLGICYVAIGDQRSALNEYKILKVLDIEQANELFDLIY